MLFKTVRHFVWVSCLVAGLAVGAQAATFSVIGNTDSNNTADFIFADNPFSNVDATGFTVAFRVTNTSANYNPIITAIALTLPSGVTGFSGAASTIPASWVSLVDYGDINPPQETGLFDFCTAEANVCTGGNPNGGIAKGNSFDFILRFTGDFEDAVLSSTAFVPLAARFQNTGSDGEGSDVAICLNGSCDGGDIPDVPEPSTVLLMGGSLLALGYFRKKRNS